MRDEVGKAAETGRPELAAVAWTVIKCTSLAYGDHQRGDVSPQRRGCPLDFGRRSSGG
jgi:hypothetical protein